MDVLNTNKSDIGNRSESTNNMKIYKPLGTISPNTVSVRIGLNYCSNKNEKK